MENIKEIQNENIQMTNTEKLTNENKRSTLFKYYSKDSIIKYGDIIIDYVITTHTGRGFIYIHPTQVWTTVLPHKTQILYLPDISFISMNLNLKICSGSFSHSIARSIFPIGHLYTFEFHEERSKHVK
ncbi:tRNA methyltransferase complex GCD14 subunit-domain-containing protein [Neocallimastix sp. 'constans']